MARSTSFVELTPDQRKSLPYCDALNYEMYYAITGDTKRLVVKKGSRRKYVTTKTLSTKTLVERDKE